MEWLGCSRRAAALADFQLLKRRSRVRAQELTSGRCLLKKKKGGELHGQPLAARNSMGCCDFFLLANSLDERPFDLAHDPRVTCRRVSDTRFVSEV